MTDTAKSTEAEELLKSAWQNLRLRNPDGAVRACRELTQSYPDHAEGWFASSFVALQLGGTEFALSAIERAIELDPGQTPWRLHKVRCLAAAGRRAEALRLAQELAGEELPDWRQCADLGLLLSSFQDYNLARSMFEQAIELEPNSGRLHYNLATVQRFLGDIDGARASVRKALELDPADPDAQLLRSGLSRQTEEDNHVDELRELLKSRFDHPLAEAQICYALAKELEDLERWPESFEILQRGANARRTSLRYDLDSDLRFIDKIMEVYDGERYNEPPGGCDSTEPIFVVGLPRTGTTLVERILSGHGDVFSAGELTNFTRQIMALIKPLAQGRNPTREEMVVLTGQVDFRALGRAYIESTRPATGQTAHFVDKFPQNSVYLGPIHLALPKARIVLVQRHPMDTCFAMYKQLFTDIYQFSYDLDELGRYFIAHQKIIEHWRNVLPEGVIHSVRYEELVSDVEYQAKELLAHCRLDWQPRVLEFHRNPQATTTASATQVREPIYASSIGRWKNYREQLEPLAEMLDQAGCLAGWEDPD